MLWIQTLVKRYTGKYTLARHKGEESFDEIFNLGLKNPRKALDKQVLIMKVLRKHMRVYVISNLIVTVLQRCLTGEVKALYAIEILNYLRH